MNGDQTGEVAEQSAGTDPRAKRNSGLFAFFKWFRPGSRESVTEDDSSSSRSGSLESVASDRSTGTVASFRYVSPTVYEGKAVAPEKRVVIGPETDTYRARLKQRDKRRESDKNVTLRKKYNLFFHKETLLRPHKPSPEDENSKSLPLMTKTHIIQEDEPQKVHRRTNSESSKLKRAGAYVHVRGKRKAPQPPTGAAKLPIDTNATSSLRRKKRLAPTPPPKVEITQDIQSEVLSNDCLKLDHGVLKPLKEDSRPKTPQEETTTDTITTIRSNIVEAPVSPRPWYKRNSVSKDLLIHKENKYEPIERLPEVSFVRNSTLDLTLEDALPSPDKEKKRKSGMSFLTNISELDREACEIIKNKSESNRVLSEKGSENLSEIPEFMKPKDVKSTPTDSWVSPKRRSARDLIAKFNAITGVTKTTMFGGGHKDKYFGKQISLDETRQRQEQLLESHKKRIEDIDKKKEDKYLPLMKSESAKVVKLETTKETTPKLERKSWKCPKCNLDNEYWRIICHVCSAIKPYFDDFASTKTNGDKLEAKPCGSPLPVRQKDVANLQSNLLERSKTQIGFSALANLKKTETKNDVEERCKVDESSKKEERDRLKKMLIEMKNSLPKRKSHMLMKQNSRTSIIVEKPEEVKVEPPKPEKTQEEKVIEVLIGSSQTVYEDIRVRKSASPKPVKVSASAQTSSNVKKLVPESTLKKFIEKHNPNELYEPMKVQDFENIYSDKNGKSPARIYANLAQNDELSLFFNVPKNIANLKTNLANGETSKNHHTDTIEINRLLRRLETAIAKGDMTEAATFAKDLAQLKVNCSVIRQKTAQLSGKDKGFQVDMYVEDKVSHRGPFSINVTEMQTVTELKQQITREFEIPAEVQKWILGKELVIDDSRTLKDYKIIPGCPIFLYLVIPDKKQAQIMKLDKNLPSTSGNCVRLKTEPENKRELPKDSKIKAEAPKVVNVIPKAAEAPLAKPEIIRVIEKSGLTKEAAKVLPTTRTELKVDIKSYPQRYESKDVKSGLVRATATKVEVLQAPPVIVLNAQITPSIDPISIPTTTKNVYPNLLNISESKVEEYDSNTIKPRTQWECHLCTLLNPLNSNICAVCATVRLQKNTLKKSSKKKPAPQPQTYLQLVNLDSADLVPNADAFECVVCFLEIEKNQGVILRECLHQFCKDCLARTVEYSDEAEVKCPYRDDVYSCNIALQEREIKALVSPMLYEQHLAKSMTQAENQMEKTFHCKTPDCRGWCIFEDNLNEFRCPVCRKTNCLTCQAIHMGANCKQYQQRMEDESDMNEDARRTKDFLEEMVEKGEAIACPTCKVILMKKWGCDWLRCSMCKTEICWVTRGPRWGPGGKGDSSGGCQCGVNGVKCHPKCNYCH